MFFLIGILIASFLELLLLVKKNKTRADKILTIWLILITIHQVFFYLELTETIYEYPHVLGIQFPMPILHGVFLYFYAMEITGNKLNKKWSVLVHLIPAASLVILAIPFYVLSPEEKLHVFRNEGVGYEWFIIYSMIIIPLSGIIYSFWTFILIKRHGLSIQNNFSNTDNKELQWLKYLSIGYAIIWIISIFFNNEIIYSAVVCLVLFIGVFGINQLNIFNTHQEVPIKPALPKKTESKRATIKKTTKRYAKSGLSDSMSTKIYKNLNELILSETPYRNDNLTLTELAKQLEVHPNHLSQVINEKEEKNFYNYINALRINDFIKQASIPESKKYTLMSLAYDCGFSSKSTFNKHFKLNTGKTPTDFFNRTT